MRKESSDIQLKMKWQQWVVISRWLGTRLGGRNAASLSRLWFAMTSGLLSLDPFALPVRPEDPQGCRGDRGGGYPGTRKKDEDWRVSACEVLLRGGAGREGGRARPRGDFT